MHLAHYLGLLHRGEENLAQAFREVADGHSDEVDVFHTCQKLDGVAKVLAKSQDFWAWLDARALVVKTWSFQTA